MVKIYSHSKLSSFEQCRLKFKYRYIDRITVIEKSRMTYELWKNTESYDENTYRLALGLAYDPLSGYGQWYERIPLRCGGNYRVLPFEKNDNKIYEKSISFGGSIPLKSSGKKIDIGIKYLLRGDKNKHGVREKTVMFYFGITGFDIFSKRAKRTGPREIPQVDY